MYKLLNKKIGKKQEPNEFRNKFTNDIIWLYNLVPRLCNYAQPVIYAYIVKYYFKNLVWFEN